MAFQDSELIKYLRKDPDYVKVMDKAWEIANRYEYPIPTQFQQNLKPGMELRTFGQRNLSMILTSVCNSCYLHIEKQTDKIEIIYQVGVELKESQVYSLGTSLSVDVAGWTHGQGALIQPDSWKYNLDMKGGTYKKGNSNPLKECDPQMIDKALQEYIPLTKKHLEEILLTPTEIKYSCEIY